jgi:hypothetical protein
MWASKCRLPINWRMSISRSGRIGAAIKRPPRHPPLIFTSNFLKKYLLLSLPNRLFSRIFLTKILYVFLVSPRRAIVRVRHNCLHFTSRALTMGLLCDPYEWRTSSLCNRPTVPCAPVSFLLFFLFFSRSSYSSTTFMSLQTIAVHEFPFSGLRSYSLTYRNLMCGDS